MLFFDSIPLRPRAALRSCAAAAVLCAMTVLAAEVHALEFQMDRLPIARYFVDDQGVADVDGDGNLDIFTTNHNSEQVIAYGNGDGTFSPVAVALEGMAQNPDFPGLADSRWKPGKTEEGFFVYSRHQNFFLRREGLGELGTVRGSITFVGRSTLDLKGWGFRRTITCNTDGVQGCRLDFEVPADGFLKFENTLSQGPTRLVLDDNIPLRNVFLGSYRVNPASHDMLLRLMDRHGIAWTDVDGDGSLDAYISSGGSSGVLDEIREQFPDLPYNNELFCQRGGGFVPCIEGTGLFKEADRGRRVAWVDFNGDGRLDLHLANHSTPNRLFQRLQDGTFADRAPDLGFDLSRTGPFVWFDADNDGDPDLLSAEQDSLVLYRANGGGSFVRETVGAYLGGYQTWSHAKVSLFDHDNDGYLEVLIASPLGSSIVDNERGQLSARPADQLGLPAQSYSLEWVDVDNDGVPEVHALTRSCDGDGIYREQAGGTYVITSLLPELFRFECRTGRSFWFDADGNGFSDLVLLRKTRAPSRNFWKAHILRNGGNGNRWLQVDLAGPAGNAQGLGARVTVRAGNRAYVQQVGQFEGSRYSQGHYRLYFGLGGASRVDRIDVAWSDGTSSTFEGVAANQRVTLAYSSGRRAASAAKASKPAAPREGRGLVCGPQPGTCRRP